MNHQLVVFLAAAGIASCLAVASAGSPSSCIIAPAGTKSCSGVTGPKCFNESYLLSEAKANHLSVLVCVGGVQEPKTKTILLSINVPSCRHCSCFLVPQSEKRSCSALFDDANFVKKSCSDQATLQSFLVNSPLAKACLREGNSGHWLQLSHYISAKL